MNVLPRSGEWTVAELELLPDDGLKYELVDGTLLVSPTPSITHQRVHAALFRVLDPVVPDDGELFMGRVDFQPNDRLSLQPDVLVMSRQDKGDKAATLPLILAVEILSPSSRIIDLVLKRALYEQSGVLHYWVADPATRTIQVWDLVGGQYGEVRVVRDAHPLEIVAPVRLTLTAEAVFGAAAGD